MTLFGGKDSDIKSKDEEEWKIVLHQLSSETKSYEQAVKSKDANGTEQHSREVISLMRRAAEVHPEPKTREKFRHNADTWEKGDTRTRKRMIHPLLQGLGIILIAPLALAGVGIFAAGAVVYGSGKLLVGLGDVITLGQLRRYTCGTFWE
ncbi:unnamed protein product [Somion occarium]|uniref:Uncharacterized protein n=1 Tax=Somion occarium TaxID=3059160 RepID=A0ABP1DWD3_9APHY